MIDLGVMVSAQTILETARREQVDIIGRQVDYAIARGNRGMFRPKCSARVYHSVVDRRRNDLKFHPR